MVQVNGDAVEIVHPPGARIARRVGRPARVRLGGVWIEHGVINHELATSLEKVAQRGLAPLALEDVVLVDELPRQLTALATQLVAHVRELFLLAEVLLARRHPFVV